ncbi:MAG: hypothetical protein M0R32_12000, partial [Candidatus Cloacimonetes bacterium]|nr:hypothetical protein [Candidatus Cloacimonadota bacterium]
FPIVLFSPKSRMFVNTAGIGDECCSLVTDPQQATIFPMIGNEPEAEEECKEEMLDTIESLIEYFGEVIPLHVSITVDY